MRFGLSSEKSHVFIYCLQVKKLCEVNNHKNVFKKLKFFFYSKTIYLIAEKVSEVFSTNERIIQVLVTTLCVSDSTFRTLQFVRFRSSVPLTEFS